MAIRAIGAIALAGIRGARKRQVFQGHTVQTDTHSYRYQKLIAVATLPGASVQVEVKNCQSLRASKPRRPRPHLAEDRNRPSKRPSIYGTHSTLHLYHQ